MSETNAELTRRFYGRLSEGDLGVVDEVLSNDFVEHEAFPGLEPNKAGVRKMFELFHTAFRDARFEVDDIIADEDKVAVRARMTGTHQAEFMGIPASGHTIDVGIGDYFRVDDGRLVEHWGVMDTGALMQQLTGA